MNYEKEKSAHKNVRIWWGKMDSNHRRHCQQIYSLSPLATREFPHIIPVCKHFTRKTYQIIEICFPMQKHLKRLAARRQSIVNRSELSPTRGAGGRTRTPDLLITNQLLYQLSYTSLLICFLSTDVLYYIILKTACQEFFKIFLIFLLSASLAFAVP